MTNSLLIVAVSTPSMALRYAAAFFLVVVGIGLIYALVRLGGTLGSAEKLLTDVDTEIVPLLKQATETLDGVNTELDKVDVVMSSVVDVTEKVDQTTRVVESAITVPAKKAAAFGAGRLAGRLQLLQPGLRRAASRWPTTRSVRAAPRGVRRQATLPRRRRLRRPPTSRPRLHRPQRRRPRSRRPTRACRPTWARRPTRATKRRSARAAPAPGEVSGG